MPNPDYYPDAEVDAALQGDAIAGLYPVGLPAADPGPYRVEYVTRRGDGWASNALTFDRVEDAEREAQDRAFRWTAVKLARVVPTSTPDRQPCNYDDPGPVVVDYR